jgi:signal transduction histidine kinase
VRFEGRVGWHLGAMLAVIGGWALVISFGWHARPVGPFITGLLLGLVAWNAKRFVHRLGGPIELLTEASRRFGAGELSTRVRLPAWWRGRRRHRHRRGPFDELLELGETWNDMAARIEALVHGQRELLANVSHELRSPLARVRVALELLPRTPATEARFAEVVGDLEELDRLIGDVLTTARLEGGAAPLRREPVALGPLLEGLRARAEHDPATVGREVRVAGDGVVQADPALLRRALWNLIENAARYGAPPILLEAERRGDGWALRVSDAGPGVPEADRARVLEPFVRLDEARTPGAGERRGVGLGLTIARQIARAHGGDLTLDAGSAGRGLRATVTIPD